MINKSNYESYFMSYIDNELSAADKAAVEAFVYNHPKYAKSLEIFKSTKLEAPRIEMEDKIFLYRFPEMQAKLENDFKKSLYKKEITASKVKISNWSLKAVYTIAAMLILCIGVVLLKPNNKIHKNTSSNTATLTPRQKPNTFITKNDNKKLNTHSNQFSSSTTILANNSNGENKSSLLTDINNPIQENNTTSNSTSILLNEHSATTQSQVNNALSAYEKVPGESTTQNEIQDGPKNIHLTTATYQEIRTDEEENTINIGMFEINGSAFRGITRRVSAIFKKNKIEKEK